MLPSKPTFDCTATLHFLPSGDYLFVDHERGGLSKFLPVPAVAAAFSGLGRDSGWIPPGLVRHGHGPLGAWYVYSAPAQKVKIQVLESVLEIPLPRTVVYHCDKTVHIWALSCATFDPGAMAYHLPLPNVYQDGKVCWGKNAAPAADPGQARKTWELFFTGTAFNADLANGKSKAFPASIVAQLEAVAGANKYPAADLVSTNKKIGSLIDSFIKD